MRIGTARHDKVRQGTGTVRRFIGDRTMTLIGLERRAAAPLGQMARSAKLDGDKHIDGGTIFLTCAPDLSTKLQDRYGVKNEKNIDMSRIIGAACSYTETACGMLVKLDLLEN